MTDKQFKYLIKLIVIMGLVSACLAFLGSTIASQRLLSQMDKSYQQIMEWSKKADLANEQLNDLYKVQQIKESYESQGVGAEEEPINKEE